MKNYYQQLQRTRRLWCAVVLLLCALGVSRAYTIKHYPLTVNFGLNSSNVKLYEGYGGVGYTTSSYATLQRANARALTINDATGSGSLYIYATEYAVTGTGASNSVYHPAYFLGFAENEENAVSGTYISHVSADLTYSSFANTSSPGGRSGSNHADYKDLYGSYVNNIPFTGSYRTKDVWSKNTDIYACFTMIKQEAFYQLSEGETEVPASYGTVTRSIQSVAVPDVVTLTATANANYEFVGWRIKEQYNESTGKKKDVDDDYISNSVTLKIGKGTDYPITARTIYEGVFKKREQKTGNYVHTQVAAYPTANVNLAKVASDIDGSTTVSDITAAAVSKTVSNDEKGLLHFYAKRNQGYFLGFADGETNAKIANYIEEDDVITITKDEKNGVYKLSGYGSNFDGTNAETPTDENTNHIYAVFTMLTASAVSSNGADLSYNTNITIENTTEGYKDITAIGYGQSAKLTAVALSTNYSFLGWRVKGTNTYLPANSDGTLSLKEEDTKEAAEYEAVFDSNLELVFSEAAELDGKYWATVPSSSNANEYITFPEGVTAYIVRFGDTVDTSNLSVVENTSTSSASELSAYTIPKVYADEDARTISLDSGAGIQLTLDELGAKGINYVKLESSQQSLIRYNWTLNYSQGNSGMLGNTNTNYTTRADSYHKESATNRQAVLVAAAAPGLYTLTRTSASIAYTTYGNLTWPRYNRLSARDEAFTPDLTNYDYYVLSKKNGRVAFYPVKEGREIPAGKGYIRVAKGATSETKEYIDFLPNGGTPTGIESVNTENNDVNAPAYNLSGQRVGDEYKGIVIVNGKKYVRK